MNCMQIKIRLQTAQHVQSSSKKFSSRLFHSFVFYLLIVQQKYSDSIYTETKRIKGSKENKKSFNFYRF